MKRFALVPVALAVIAGCATEDKATPAPPPVVVAPQPPAPVVVAPAPSAGTAVVVPTPNALVTGVGVVDSVTSSPASAAAGGSAGSSSKRVGVRMANNTIQYLDTRAVGLKVGDRVEITQDGMLRHPVP